MYKSQTDYRRLPAILLFMAGIVTGPLTVAGPAEVAAEPTEVVETGAPVLTGVISRVLADPNRDYASARGPDDCSSESLYNSAKGMLGKYVDSPVENSGKLKEYIMSGEEQCNCTAAIVGQDFDILLAQLGTDISSVPCL
jgi:hypothetical protein